MTIKYVTDSCHLQNGWLLFSVATVVSKCKTRVSLLQPPTTQCLMKHSNMLKFSIFIVFFSAYPEYGFSGYIATTQELLGNEWYKIHTWLISPAKSWQYSESKK